MSRLVLNPLVLVRQASVRLFPIQEIIFVLTVDPDALILHYKILCALDPIKVLDHIARAYGVQGSAYHGNNIWCCMVIVLP